MMRRQWVIWYAVVLHVVWGAVLMFSAAPANTTPLAKLSKLLPPQLLGAVLLAVGLWAGLATWRGKHSPSEVAGLLVQQGLLVATGISSLWQVALGCYADGVPRPWAFIFADQLPSILAPVMHTFALLDAFVWTGNGWTRRP